MRIPQIQIANPGQRILGAGQNKNVNLLKNRVDARLFSTFTITGGSSGFPLVGAVLKPSAGDSLELHSCLSYSNNAEIGAAYEFDVAIFEGAFTVNGLAPVPGVYYGDGTAGTNVFAGGTNFLFMKLNKQTLAAGGDDVITINALLQLPNPLLGPNVGIAVFASVTGGNMHFAGSENSPVGDTWMREML